ncbi:MAG: phage tail protein I [Coriobacteriaceae bacterium]|nr:phage tail protein I [Coriobacteriaceae bacterium]
MSDNPNGITKENLLSIFPSGLTRSESVNALAAAVAKVLAERPAEIAKVLIYPAIDELPEDLLDILAYDFKVDWYDYNYSLEVKRRLIKTSFYVHRTLGTKAAVQAAVTAIWPNSRVEEWFEYGGEPYWFRVVLDPSEETTFNVTNDDLVWAINFYKSLRSHWDGTITYHCPITILIGCKCGWIVYAAPYCGMFPSRSTQGGHGTDGIIVETDGGIVAYATPATGTLRAGLVPDKAYQGSMLAEDTGGGISYNTRMCGSEPGSLI